ncbi:MAG TPA: DUF1585 domain-containing protein, partial [Polyangiaceae bacterium]|nr:DUF1585 domain-containing protein [Polyangiaceae bacterium]
GLGELSEILSKDERLEACVVKKMMTYALSRELVATDAGYVAQIQAAWSGGKKNLTALLEQIVLSPPFRSRRGEAP